MFSFEIILMYMAHVFQCVNEYVLHIDMKYVYFCNYEFLLINNYFSLKHI